MNAKEFYEYQLNDKTSVVGRQDKDEIIMLMEEYHKYKVKNLNISDVDKTIKTKEECLLMNSIMSYDLGKNEVQIMKAMEEYAQQFKPKQSGCPKCGGDMIGDGSKSWCDNYNCDFIETD